MKLNKTNISNAIKVQTFYDNYTDKFLAVYGNIIQAFRTINVNDYLDYTIQSARIKNQEHILDAGCGVCGPAIYFAQQFSDINIEACTISSVQAEKAQANIAQAKTEHKINITQADYHLLTESYGTEKFDLIYFLESFGHSNQKNQLIDECWNVLKPGGRVYIKDLFKRVSHDEWEQLRINEICDDIDSAYEYHIANLNDVLDKIRSKGFQLNFVKIPEVELSQFEHLSISNQFQNLFDVGKIKSWDNYVFPIDFYEILATKPIIPTKEDMHLYFLNKK